MHIPPYYKLASWQRFFAGILFGGVIAYIFLLYMHGEMYEDLIMENIEMNETISDLTKQNEALLENRSETSSPTTVREIEIIITNPEAYRDDGLLDSQLKSLIKQEINHLIGIEVPVLSESQELLISAVENKEFTIDSVTYQFTITRLTIDAKLKITVETKLSN